MATSEKKFSMAITILSAIIVVLGFALYKTIQSNKRLTESLPYFIEGESIEYFDLLSMAGDRIDASALESDTPILIFIFSRPCSPCNKNIKFWKSMVGILKDKKIEIFGIVLDNLSATYNFMKEARLNFDIYVPDELEIFLKRMRIKLNFAQTILYHKGVKVQKLGPLEADEVTKIINYIKKSTYVEVDQN
jgi:peroxiredoxin